MKQLLDAINAGQSFRWVDNTSHLEMSKTNVMSRVSKARYNCTLVQHEHTANCTYIVFPNIEGKIAIWINQG